MMRCEFNFRRDRASVLNLGPLSRSAISSHPLAS